MSNKPESLPPVAGPPQVPCPYCGRLNQITATHCWLCYQFIGKQPLSSVPITPPTSTARVLLTVFGVLGLAAATVVAVLIGLFAICVSALSA